VIVIEEAKKGAEYTVFSGHFHGQNDAPCAPAFQQALSPWLRSAEPQPYLRFEWP